VLNISRLESAEISGLIMITEEEAFWSGIAVATLMLGGGFSMLFLRTLTGEGAVVLALGLMTMALTIQMRARPRRYVDSWSPVEARAMTPLPPVESSTEPEQTQTETQNEAQAEPQPSQPQEEAAEPAEQPQPEPVEQPQPTQPEPPVAEKNEPPAPEVPKEEPIVVF
jgi:outer membrane biosynthesis protein TonB